MQTVTSQKGTVVRHIAFVLIIAMGFVAVTLSRAEKVPTADVTIYFTDAEMLRLIPLEMTVPKISTQKMAERVLDELIEGRDDNPKIRRTIPKEKNCMSVKVKDNIAYVDIKPAMIENHPDGRDLEALTVYSIVNSLTSIDGIVNVRFTVSGAVQKDFMGYIDMRETFIPDYFQ